MNDSINKKNIKGIVFDKDGTLFDFNAVWAVWCDRVIDELCSGDEDMANELAGIIGYHRGSRTFVSGSLIVSAAADDTAKALAGHLDGVTYEQVVGVCSLKLRDLPLAPVNDLEAVLSALRNYGFKLGVATNDLEASAIDQLRHSNTAQYFDFICGFDSGFGSKPQPGMIEAFCQASNLKSCDVLMVGDSLHDINAGKAAGVAATVGVLTGPASRVELETSADIVMADIGELIDWLTE